MNEQDLRDCFAMFALNGLMASGSNDEVPYKVLASNAFEIADVMLEARSRKEEEQGIVAIKKKPRSRT
jgi:hypothetical protein